MKKTGQKPVKSPKNCLKSIWGKIRYLDYLLESNQEEASYINETLKEKEKEIIKEIYKNKLLVANNKDKKEITKYINKIFEQQEKERIVRWLINSIRESLDLDQVLEKTVEEVGRFLNVDRCFIALYDNETKKINIRNEYRINDEIKSIFGYDYQSLSEIAQDWLCYLPNQNETIIINNSDKDIKEKYNHETSSDNAKSFIITPLVHKEEFLGIIAVSQINTAREWENLHIEILKDTASQIAIAVRQAILYTKVQETTKLKSDFLANMSHEFRTPLNAIIGFSDMLLSENYGDLNEKQKKFMGNISVSGRHLLTLVNDILDHSKIESGKMNLDYEFFDINQTIHETVSVLKDLSSRKNLTIETNLEDNIIINADISKFKQILYNLIINAIKFTEENGSIIINTTLDNDSIKIEIIDTGIGIPANNRDKIFQKFSQLEAAYTKKQEGTGLGLALTKKLVEMHGGQIDFDSKDGKGSRFWFVLPNAKRVPST